MQDTIEERKRALLRKAMLASGRHWRSRDSRKLVTRALAMMPDDAELFAAVAVTYAKTYEFVEATRATNPDYADYLASELAPYARTFLDSPLTPDAVRSDLLLALATV